MVPGMSNGFLTGRDLGGDFSGGCLLGSRRTEKPVRSLPFSGSDRFNLKLNKIIADSFRIQHSNYLD